MATMLLQVASSITATKHVRNKPGAVCVHDAGVCVCALFVRACVCMQVGVLCVCHGHMRCVRVLGGVHCLLRALSQSVRCCVCCAGNRCWREFVRQERHDLLERAVPVWSSAYGARDAAWPSGSWRETRVSGVCALVLPVSIYSCMLSVCQGKAIEKNGSVWALSGVCAPLLCSSLFFVCFFLCVSA